MPARLWVVSVLVAAVAAAAPADDVRIHVIRPDGKTDVAPPANPASLPAAPASASGPSSKPSQPAQASPVLPIAGLTGDFMADALIYSLRLTPDQMATLKPVFDASREQSKTPHQEQARKTAELSARMSQEWANARQAAARTGANPASQPSDAARQLMLQLQETNAAYAKELETRRGPLMEKVRQVLTPSQRSRLRDMTDVQSKDTKVRDLASARMRIEHAAPGVELSEDQRDQLAVKISELIQKDQQRMQEEAATMRQMWQRLSNDPKDAEARKAQQEWSGRAGSAAIALNRSIRDAVESALTPEQKQAAATARSEIRHKAMQAAMQTHLWGLSRVDPTAEQKKQADELIEAAVDAASKLDEADPAVGAIHRKLAEDIAALLTDRQKTRLTERTVQAPPRAREQ